MTGTPAPFKAAAKASLCRNGTVLSASPCMIKNGGSSLDTYVIGLAFRAVSRARLPLPPISWATGCSVIAGSMHTRVRSARPYQSITPCTRLDSAGGPGSHSAASPAVPSSAARCPRPSPPGDHAIPIDMVLRGMRPQPAYRRLAVLDLGGELGILTQAIIDAGHDVALIRPRQRNAAVLAALFPRTAVDPHDQREGPAAFGRNVKVKLLAVMAAGHISEVLENLQARGVRRECFGWLRLLRKSETGQKGCGQEQKNQARYSSNRADDTGMITPPRLRRIASYFQGSC